MSDAIVLTGRAVRLSRRNLDAVLTAMLLPVMLMLVFVYFFGGAINTGTEYVTYVVPGVMLLCAGFGSANTAVTVTHDMTGGIIDRFRSLDIGGTAIVAGHVAASVLRNAVATAIVFGVAFLIGFRPDAGPLEWLAVAGVLLLFILAISWLSACFGLIARSPEAAGGFTFLMMFLPYPSSAFVPIDTMPGWLHGFAGHQPVTPLIETLRALLLDRPVGDSGWQALVWCGSILVVAIALSGVLFRRRTV
ncbi:ABC transporter permease [Streptomyces sp. NA02950]|uniref:ABC transporter permease n=1 Tax=Streptomyces sp. NA02950 TaxID=2742137 RepID=UPI001590F936|nr:ABC transporter permease [Streptomyces sp. NA02950]QKV93480.1 ABC transporter permease [Streptomyces sp. NA02950]